MRIHPWMNYMYKKRGLMSRKRTTGYEVFPQALRGRTWQGAFVEGRDELVISPDIIKEVPSVLSSRFGREREALSHVAVILLELGEWVRPHQRVRVFRNEPDNRILEWAVFGKADLIVTGDKEMLRVKEYMEVKIAGLRDYIESWDQSIRFTGPRLVHARNSKFTVT
jgi:putative PIN family toxin of toxin-antitoxin system